MDLREPYFDRNKMMTQLQKLEKLIKILDQFLFDHLEKHDALNLVPPPSSLSFLSMIFSYLH